MLQQTQVNTVRPRYEAWLARFPNIAALAAADEDAVLKAWEGLGYYRRARLMHAAARRIMAEHAGCFPRDFAAILALPGIGRSTAGAIGSICFDIRKPVLDGNVKRVLGRWHGLDAPKEAELWRLAEAAIATADDPGEWNQAMMELGATVCAPRAPDCERCPVSAHCAAAFAVCERRRPGSPVRVRDAHWRVRLHRHPARGLWFVRRPPRGIWAGLWTPPSEELTGPPGRAPDHVHPLTHRRLHLYAEHADVAPQGDGRWVHDLHAIAIPTGSRRLLAQRDRA
ncbi:MAG: NUDIX domain-containing protein [Mariprofundaceae bacterium]